METKIKRIRLTDEAYVYNQQSNTFQLVKCKLLHNFHLGYSFFVHKSLDNPKVFYVSEISTGAKVYNGQKWYTAQEAIWYASATLKDKSLATMQTAVKETLNRIWEANTKFNRMLFNEYQHNQKEINDRQRGHKENKAITFDDILDVMLAIEKGI